MKNKTIIFGLVGSGKSTLYRKLNEEKICSAVEIELPQSCIADDKLKERLFRLFFFNDAIDTIIMHPYFLCSKFLKIAKSVDIEVTYKFLEIPLIERLKRIEERSNSINSNCKIFTKDFIEMEEMQFKNLMNLLKRK